MDKLNSLKNQDVTDINVLMEQLITLIYLNI